MTITIRNYILIYFSSSTHIRVTLSDKSTIRKIRKIVIGGWELWLYVKHIYVYIRVCIMSAFHKLFLRKNALEILKF